MLIDTNENIIKVNLGIGNTDNLLDLGIQFLRTRYDRISKLFYKIDFRKSEDFYTFPKAEFYPQSSLIMRVIDVFAFRGDHIVSKGIYDLASPTSTSAFLSSNEEVVLQEFARFAPNKRMQFDPSLNSLEQTKFGNFRFDFFGFGVYTMASINNCLHEVDTTRCMVCEAGFVLDVSGSICLACMFSTVYAPFLNSCVFVSLPVTNYRLKPTMSFDHVFSNIETFNLSSTETRVSTIWAHFSNVIATEYDEDTLNTSITLNLSDHFVHVLSVHIKIKFDDFLYSNNPVYGLNFNNFSSTSSSFVNTNFPLDRAVLNEASFEKDVIFYPVVFCDTNSYEFMFSTFFYSVNRQAGSSLSESQIVQDHIFTLNEILSYLDDSSEYPNAKMHPVTFPLEPVSGVKNVYFPYGLLKYQAVEVRPDTIPPVGYYFEVTHTFYYLRKCPEFCEACSSFEECTSCEHKHFLRSGACFPCSPGCDSCSSYSNDCVPLDVVPQNVDPPDTQKPTCEDNEYLDLVAPVCEPCQQKCMECTSLDTCTKCHFGFILENKECVSIDPCKPPGSDPRSTVSSCVKCPVNCLFCEEATGECVQCEPGHFLDGNFCVSCPANCVFCVGSLQCRRCRKGYEIVSGHCKQMNIQKGSNNTQNTTKNVITSSTKTTKSSAMTDTTKSTNNLPVSCEINLTSNATTCSICTTGFYLGSDFACYKCPANCKKCLSDRLCLKCARNFKLELKQASVTCARKQVPSINPPAQRRKYRVRPPARESLRIGHLRKLSHLPNRPKCTLRKVWEMPSCVVALFREIRGKASLFFF